MPNYCRLKHSCPMGFTMRDLDRLFDPASLSEFYRWMEGGTVGFCNGRIWDPIVGVELPSSCADHPHQNVYYPQDVLAFINHKPPLD